MRLPRKAEPPSRPVPDKRLALGEDMAVSGALFSLVFVAATGFARVYAGSSWARPVLISAAASAGVTFLARRARLRAGAAAICGLLALWVASTELVLHAGMTMGLPLLGALSAAEAASRQAAAAFGPSVAPARTMAGFVLWSAWGAGIVMVAGDWLAVSMRSLAGLVPPLLLFVTCCVFGTATGRAWAIGTFVAAAVVFTMAHQWAVGYPHTRLAPDVVRGRFGPAGHPGRPFYYQGTAFVAVAVLAGIVLVPALGRDGAGPAGWRRHGFVNPVRLTPDPMVSLQANLVQNSDIPVFVVRTRAASYWRLTSLDYFDGTTWQASGSYQDVQDTLPGVKTLTGARQVIETFGIEDLASPWLPVAFQPESVTGAVGVSYDPASGSLLTSNQTADGEHYQVKASENLAAVSPVRLGQARAITPEERAAMRKFLQLPAGLPASLARLALQLTAGANSEYGKARELQDFFHRSPFVYTLDPPGGTAGSALVNFLFQTHAGYCQQYAGAFAVLARLAGLPTRIAVGFDTGTEVAPGTWQVLDKDSHAWPEVWFPGTGWVPFEPTPAFSIPGATQYTGPTGGPQSAAWHGTTAPRPGTTTVRRGTLAAGAAKPKRGAKRTRQRPPGAGKSPGAGVVPWSYVHWLATTVAALAVLATAWAGLVRAGRQLRWRRRRRRLVPTNVPGAPAASVGRLLLTWEELSEELASAGLRRHASETPAEWARRAAGALGAGGALNGRERASLTEIGDVLSAAAYGGRMPTPEQLVTLEQAAAQIAQRARRTRSRRRRVADWVDPRPAWHPVTVGATPGLRRRRLSFGTR